jgi:hypothetical protein
MPILLKNVEGSILDNFETTTKLLRSVEGFYGQEDYIKLGSFEAFLQDFRYVPVVSDLTPPPTFGLKNKTEYVTLEISY